MKRRTWVGLGIGALALAGLVVATRARATNAEIARAHDAAALEASRGPRTVRAEGRVAVYPGAEVTLGTDTGGTLVAMRAEEKDHVKKGQILAEIRSDSERAALSESWARAHEADVDIAYFTKEKDRSQRLVLTGSLPPQTLDRNVYDEDAASARRRIANATATRLAADLDKLKIAAPFDGTILAKHAEQSETVAAGAKLYTLCDLSRTRIEAEVDEFDSSAVTLGAKVVISTEGRADTWEGKVEELPNRVEPRTLRPEDPSRPTDTRVLRVKIATPSPLPLYLGQRVDVRIEAH